MYPRKVNENITLGSSTEDCTSLPGISSLTGVGGLGTEAACLSDKQNTICTSKYHMLVPKWGY